MVILHEGLEIYNQTFPVRHNRFQYAINIYISYPPLNACSDVL